MSIPDTSTFHLTSTFIPQHGTTVASANNMASEFVAITPGDRIRELSNINNDVAAMLNSAGQAINALTNRPVTSSDGDAPMTDDASNTVDAHKEAFNTNMDAYFTSLQAVFARLKRQAYALEEAGIIEADNSALGSAIPRSQALAVEDTPRGMPPGAPKKEPERITNGGLGKFDVGWLNSRGNKVGEEKEAELIQEAKELLEMCWRRARRVTVERK